MGKQTFPFPTGFGFSSPADGQKAQPRRGQKHRLQQAAARTRRVPLAYGRAVRMPGEGLCQLGENSLPSREHTIGKWRCLDGSEKEARRKQEPRQADDAQLGREAMNEGDGSVPGRRGDRCGMQRGTRDKTRGKRRANVRQTAGKAVSHPVTLLKAGRTSCGDTGAKPWVIFGDRNANRG